jgi:hypothetical protein
MGYGKERPCKKCLATKLIQARRLCQSCFSEEKKAGRLDSWPTARTARPLFGETSAIKTVVTAGALFGYGNMIGRLQMAWVLALKKDGMSWEMAASGALLTRREISRILKSAETDEAKLIKHLQSFTGESE